MQEIKGLKLEVQVFRTETEAMKEAYIQPHDKKRESESNKTKPAATPTLEVSALQLSSKGSSGVVGEQKWQGKLVNGTLLTRTYENLLQRDREDPGG